MRLSIIVPVWNVEKYLSRCLDSVLNQTFTDMEIICINDGSTDNSEQILKDYAKKDARIKLLQLDKNSGVSVARNAGIDKASGEYIGFIDSDDWIDEDFYEKLLSAIEISGADIGVAGIRLVYEDHNFDITQKVGVFNNLNNKIQRLPHGSVWDKVFKRSLIFDNNIKFPEGKYFEDNLFLIKAVTYSNRIVVLDDVFYYYFKNPLGICGKESFELNNKKLRDRLFVSTKIVEFAKEKKFNLINRYLLDKFLIRSILPEYSENKKEINKILGKTYKVIRKIKKILKKSLACFLK